MSIEIVQIILKSLIYAYYINMYILAERTDWGGKYSFTSFGKHYIKWNIFFFHCLGRNGLVDSESEFSDWSGRHKCSLQIYDSSCSCGGGERGKEEESRLPYTEEEIELHYKSRTFIYWTIESRRKTCRNGGFGLSFKLFKSVERGCSFKNWSF